MLNVERSDPRSNDTIIRALTDDPDTNPMALGCAACPLKDICGGLCVKQGIVDCLDFCCGSPDRCTRVCRNKPNRYVDQVREIGDFHLRNVPRAPQRETEVSQDIVPLVYHGSSRVSQLSNGVFALRLPDLVNFRTGQLRFPNRKELCRAFHLSQEADLILTGVGPDHRIEPWWGLAEKRILIIKQLVEFGIKLVTTPNFSLILDHPRYDDMHAMKRIALLFSEFQVHGLPCALHPNSRTEMDFTRWGRFIAAREELKTLSYEFTTGTARKSRVDFHLNHLAKLANNAGREMDIIIYGSPDVIPNLQGSFRRVIYIETTTFMKSIKRQRAVRVDNDKLKWVSAPTAVDESIDALFSHNLEERTLFLKAKHYGDSALSKVA